MTTPEVTCEDQAVEDIMAEGLALHERMYDEAMKHIAHLFVSWRSPGDPTNRDVDGGQVPFLHPGDTVTDEIPRQAA